VLGILLAIYLRQNDTYGRGQLVRPRSSQGEEREVHNEKETARNSRTNECEMKSKGNARSYQRSTSIGRDEGDYNGVSQ
jgi:hypothetical protein